MRRPRLRGSSSCCSSRSNFIHRAIVGWSDAFSNAFPSSRMLTVRGLSKTYGAADRRQVIADLDFDLPDGDFVAIMGESGIGKSTLLNLVAGLDVPDAGTIDIDGTMVSSLDDRARTLFR